MKRLMIAVAGVALIVTTVAACSSTTKSTSTPSTTSAPTTTAARVPATTAPAATTPATSAPAQSAPAPAAVVASGVYAQEPGEPAGELFTRLQGTGDYARASGSSEYSQDAAGRELDVTLTSVPALAAKTVTVYVGGTKVGILTVSDTGSAFGEWDTQHGQSVPSVAAGGTVQVKTS